MLCTKPKVPCHKGEPYMTVTSGVLTNQKSDRPWKISSTLLTSLSEVKSFQSIIGYNNEHKIKQEQMEERESISLIYHSKLINSFSAVTSKIVIAWQTP